MILYQCRVAEDLQGGGTFDSSGAFRDERWSDEDDGEGKKRRVLRKRADPSQDGSGGTEDGSCPVDSPSHVSEMKEVPVEELVPSVAPVAAAGPAAGASQAPAAAVNLSPVHRGPSPESQQSSQPVRVDEDGLEHAQAVVSTLVAQLVEDEDQPKSSPSPPNPPNPNIGMDQWFYRSVIFSR